MNVIKSSVMPNCSPDLALILNAYKAHGGTWSPMTPGLSAYLHRCPLMCGPKGDGMAYESGHQLPAGYAADWGDAAYAGRRYNGLMVCCLNGCRERDMLGVLGLARDAGYGFTFGARTRLMVTRGLRQYVLAA